MGGFRVGDKKFMLKKFMCFFPSPNFDLRELISRLPIPTSLLIGEKKQGVLVGLSRYRYRLNLSAINFGRGEVGAYKVQAYPRERG